MRLLIIGNLGGQVAEASQIAIKRGAKVSHAETTEIALDHLRSGNGGLDGGAFFGRSAHHRAA